MIASIDSAESNRAMDISSSAVPGPFLLFVRGRTIVAQRFEAGALKTSGDAAAIADGISLSQGQAFDAAGNTLAFLSPDRHSTLAWMDRAGRHISTIEMEGTAYWPALAPDGRRIAVDVDNPVSGMREIWVVEESRRSRLTFGPTHDTDAVWAPDGRRLAYGHNDGGGLYQLTIADGLSKQLRDFGGGTGHAYPADWSRDGRFIAYVSYDSSAADIWLLPTGRDATPLQVTASPFHEHQARFSPDSRYVAYSANDSGRPEIYIQALPPARGRWVVSTNGGAQPMWRGDGKELYYLTLDNTLTAVPVNLGTSTTVGTPAPLFKIRLDESIFLRYATTIPSPTTASVFSSIASPAALA